MLRNLLIVGLIGYGAYYYYHISGQSPLAPSLATPEPRYSVDNFGNVVEIPPVQIVDEKDLISVKELPHSKENNPLYDNWGNERVRIHHTFTSQVVNNIM
jgi:hypothetical protein